MRLRVLVDNNTNIDDYYLGEPGLSIYIEDDDAKILFDTGYSDIFLTNAKKMNIDLSKINYLILSHGHNDHTGGLKYLKDTDLSNVKLIAHPEVFEKRNHKGLDISSPVELNELKVKEYIDGTKQIKITDNLYFLGEIKRTTNFEDRPVGYKTRYNIPDQLKDDSALVYKTRDGLFIITACSHSGICNIINHAKETFNETRILGIIGGFHLLENNDQLDKTIEFMKHEDIKELWPSHCVSLYAKHRMYEVTTVHQVGVGLELTIND